MMSNCHKAPLITILGDEGTNHFTCKECGKPCDPLSTPPAKGEEWEGELWKLYENRTTAWVDGIVMRDFIRSTRSQAYDEGRGEGKRYIGEIKRKWYQQGAKEGRREAIEEAIAIFEKLPEDEPMIKNPIILELKVLKEKYGEGKA